MQDTFAPNLVSAISLLFVSFPSANNYPYGQFGISSSQLSGDMTSRSLSVSMTRLKGTFGTVQVQLSVVYDPQPLAAYVNRTLQMVFSPNATTAAVSLPVAAGAFLVPFTYFTLTVTNATAIVPGNAYLNVGVNYNTEPLNTDKYDFRKFTVGGGGGGGSSLTSVLAFHPHNHQTLFNPITTNPSLTPSPLISP